MRRRSGACNDSCDGFCELSCLWCIAYTDLIQWSVIIRYAHSISPAYLDGRRRAVMGYVRLKEVFPYCVVSNTPDTDLTCTSRQRHEQGSPNLLACFEKANVVAQG